MKFTACLTLLTVSALNAQTQPTLRATEAVPLIPGTVLSFDVSGAPNDLYGILIDLDGGPTEIASERFDLGFTPNLTVPFAGVIPGTGSINQSIVIPVLPALNGVAVFSQVVVPTLTAPNGAFLVSNGESSVFFGAAASIAERFDDPTADGFFGSFDDTALGRLTGVFSTRQVQPVEASEQLDPNVPGSSLGGVAIPFGFPIGSPLDPRGSRGQFVYRAQDLETTGEPEVVTKILWRAFDGSPITTDAFDSVAIRLSHSSISPNYSVGSFSALPIFPLSGLGSTFASNPSSPEVVVRTGPYVIAPADAQLLGGPIPGSYLDYGISPAFTYNGVESLLIDVRTAPSASALGVNGAQIYLPVQSSGEPASRCVASVPPLVIGTLDPDTVIQGNRVDNAIHDVIVEFTRIEAEATSPFRDSGLAAPDYDPAVLAAQTPGASQIEIVYRGADDALGTNATAFDADVNLADGKRFLQYSIRLVADLATGGVPSIDTLVVPIR